MLLIEWFGVLKFIVIAKRWYQFKNTSHGYQSKLSFLWLHYTLSWKWEQGGNYFKKQSLQTGKQLLHGYLQHMLSGKVSQLLHALTNMWLLRLYTLWVFQKWCWANKHFSYTAATAQFWNAWMKLQKFQMTKANFRNFAVYVWKNMTCVYVWGCQCLQKTLLANPKKSFDLQ